MIRTPLTAPALGVFAVCAIVLAAPPAAVAQDRITFVPALSVSSIYDDNLFARTVGSGDQMTRLTPSLEASYETPVTSILGLYSFDMQRSIDHPSLNDLQARRHAMLDSRFRRTPKLTLSLNGRYDHTDAAGEINVATGLLFDRRQAQRWQVTPSFAYQPSPRSVVTVLYDWTTEGVQGTPMANEHVARIGFRRDVTSRTTAGVGYLGRHFINGHETHTSNAALVMWTHQFSPVTVARIDAGPRLSSRGTLAPELVIGLSRRAPERFGYSLDYWRGESIILGVLGPVEVNAATARISWPVVRQAELGIRGGLFNSTTLAQGTARVYHGEAVTSWSPMASLTLAASYGADFQRGDVRTSLLSDQTVVRHVFLVRMTVAPRLSRQLQPEDPLQPLGEPSRGRER